MHELKPGFFSPHILMVPFRSTSLSDIPPPEWVPVAGPYLQRLSLQ